MVIGELIFVLKISFLLLCISCNIFVSEVVIIVRVVIIGRGSNYSLIGVVESLGYIYGEDVVIFKLFVFNFIKY